MEAKQILKSDILDLIFEGRNKAYGAYDIRKKYRDRVNIALFIAVAGIVFILSLPAIIRWLSKPVIAPKEVVHTVAVTTLEQPPSLEKPPPPPELPKPPPPEKLVFVAPKIVNHEVTDTVATIHQLEKAPVVSSTAQTGTLTYTPPAAVVAAVAPPPAVEQIHEDFDDPAVPPGGDEGYAKYLRDHIKYPQQAIDAGAKGTVTISIVVSKDGTLSDVHVEHDNVHYGCGDEAVRVIKSMPPWKPGKMNGVPVKIRMRIPVRFQLGN